MLAEIRPAGTKPRGRRPGVAGGARNEGQGASPWLYHRLTINGPAASVASFAEAARGAGVVPWRLDGAAIEEDIFNLAASQPRDTRALTIAGCRILARQFRERAEARAARAAALVGRSHAYPGRAHPGEACPFDLHALLPVPAAILDLGPAHPAARTWLLAHWGLTDSPRQVAERPGATAGRRLPRGHEVIGYGFFTARETPQAAMAALGHQWPALRLVLTQPALD